MKTSIKKLSLTVILIAFIGIGYLAWRRSDSRPPALQLPAQTQLAVARFTLGDAATYLQTDPRWADERNPGSGERLRSVGCTLCCLSMALAYHGIDLPPLVLNRRLAETGGYTENGWVKWVAVEKVASGKIDIALPQNPTHADLDAALRAGSPVLVKVFLAPGVQHWVLLVGRDGKDYLMKDPLGDGHSITPLSALRSDIYSVRIVRKL